MCIDAAHSVHCSQVQYLSLAVEDSYDQLVAARKRYKAKAEQLKGEQQKVAQLALEKVQEKGAMDEEVAELEEALSWVRLENRALWRNRGRCPSCCKEAVLQHQDMEEEEEEEEEPATELSSDYDD